MTEITSEATTASNHLASNRPVSPADTLLHVILTLLAPLFLVESGGDIQFARMAALETVNAYRASDHAGLIAVAQIVACNLTALGSLCLSMADDIPLSTLLRLRGNAVALNRCAEQNRRASRESRSEIAMPRQAEAMGIPGQPGDELHGVAADVAAAPKRASGTQAQFQAKAPTSTPAAAEPNAEAPASIRGRATAQQNAEAPASIPAAAQPKDEVPRPIPSPVAVATHAFTTMSATERQRQAAWGSAAATVAAEFAASLPRLPPAERKMATVRTAALSSAANDLLAGMPPPRLVPGDPIALLRPNPV